ncbi:MAG: hypothetical protein CMK92_03090 [Pseudomonas sp.]|nr:hypothetical protein [Pseudomonas sp.]|tara:strand:- start:608 stop:817 length:210 start_codon:yes stop_codon:yes gene_type:complete
MMRSQTSLNGSARSKSERNGTGFTLLGEIQARIRTMRGKVATEATQIANKVAAHIANEKATKYTIKAAC